MKRRPICRGTFELMALLTALSWPIDFVRTWRRRRAENGLVRSGFDVNWYLDRYPDVKNAGINPFGHYLRHGWREGRARTRCSTPTGILTKILMFAPPALIRYGIL